jgi:hypothetical protein
MMMFLKFLTIGLVGGVAFVFMRPHVPILPPAVIGRKRKLTVAEEEDRPGSVQVANSNTAMPDQASSCSPLVASSVFAHDALPHNKMQISRTHLQTPGWGPALLR